MEVSATASDAGVQIGEVTAGLTVSVWSPVHDCQPVSGGVYIEERTYNGLPYLEAGLTDVDPDGELGIEWVGSASQPGWVEQYQASGYGIRSFVQLDAPHRSHVLNGTTRNWSWNGHIGLDTTYPYYPDAVDDSNAGVPEDGEPYRSNENPREPLDEQFTSATVADRMDTYMMYRPLDDGHSPQWVPLHLIAWTWGATVYRAGYEWIAPPYIYYWVDGVHVTDDTPYPTHPESEEVIDAHTGSYWP